MTKPIEEKAIESFRSGLNCSQAVVTAYSEQLNYDDKLALSISCGFGGGMGRLQETCGAVTGSFMVLGIYNCNKMREIRKEKKPHMQWCRNLVKTLKKFISQLIALHF